MIRPLFVMLALLGLIPVVFVQQSCTPLGPHGTGSTGVAREKTLRYADAEYEPGIRTVLLVPNTGQLADDMQLPMVGRGTSQILRLEFDEMGTQFYNYYFKIIPCNWDWTPGYLQDMELADAINEYVMDGYTLSSGTRVPYVHYYAQMPKLKVTGNFVVLVYRNGNVNDFVLTRRFCVFENTINLNLEPKFSIAPDTRFTHQQVDATVRFGDYPMVNPAEQSHLVLRQNGRWDNAIMKLPPLYVRAEDALLDYHYFAGENNFEGNNEWRQFDIRSIRQRGFNIVDMQFDNTKAVARVGIDQSRDVKTYSQYIDINGRYAVVRLETQDLNMESSTSDYVQTVFTIQPPRGLGLDGGRFYVFGQLSNFQIEERFRLMPDSASGGKYWLATVPLKQGLYSYQIAYVAPGATRPSFKEMEGTYSQTENFYEGLFYYRPIGARYDHLIGYSKITFNGR